MSNLLRDTRLRYALTAVLIVILFVVGYSIGTLTGFGAPAPAPTPTPSGAARVEPPVQLTDFTLVGKAGAPMSLSDLRGKPALLFFGYTNCPEECPLTLANYTRVKQALGENGDAVSYVFISVDGQRDTPQVVSTYLDQFDPTFVGMTGDNASLQRVAREYGLYVALEDLSATEEAHEDHDPALDADNYFVQHTSPSYLIDADGRLRVVYFYGTHPDVMVQGIQELLQQPA